MLTRLQHLLTVIARIATQHSALTREIHVESGGLDSCAVLGRWAARAGANFHPVSIVSSGKAV